jgi:hypothetical protein
MSATVDMHLQEYQEILANSMELENTRAVRTMKAYYGSKPSMFIMGSNGKIQKEDYVPNDTFETDFSYVKYSMPGSDINAMVVSIGQRVGMGIMSNETARLMDPAIENPDREADLVEIEGLRKALLAGLEQQATQGSLDPSIIARIVKMKAMQHVSLEDAVQKIHEEMQEEQAEKANAMQQQAGAMQGIPGAPQGMPGEEQQMGAQPGMQPGMGISPENPMMAGPQQAPQQAPDMQSLLASLGGQGG